MEPMGCKKSKTRKKPKPGRYRCENCGQVRAKKSSVCEPAKIKKRDLE